MTVNDLNYIIDYIVKDSLNFIQHKNHHFNYTVINIQCNQHKANSIKKDIENYLQEQIYIQPCNFTFSCFDIIFY